MGVWEETPKECVGGKGKREEKEGGKEGQLLVLIIWMIKLVTWVVIFLFYFNLFFFSFFYFYFYFFFYLCLLPTPYLNLRIRPILTVRNGQV